MGSAVVSQFDSDVQFLPSSEEQAKFEIQEHYVYNIHPKFENVLLVRRRVDE
jgi:hypothetical protein